jgi:hypothetical protein
MTDFLAADVATKIKKDASSLSIGFMPGHQARNLLHLAKVENVNYEPRRIDQHDAVQNAPRLHSLFEKRESNRGNSATCEKFNRESG